MNMMNVRMTKKNTHHAAVADDLATATSPHPGIVGQPVSPDPILEAWRKWRPLANRENILNRKRESLDEKPGAVVGILSDRDGAETPVLAFDDAEIERHYGPGGIFGYDPERLATIKAELAALQAARAAIDVNALQDEADKVASEADALIAPMLQPAPATAAAVAARVDLAINFSGETYLEDYPVEMFTVIVRDLMPNLPSDMQAMLAPIASGKGLVHDAYLPTTTKDPVTKTARKGAKISSHKPHVQGQPKKEESNLQEFAQLGFAPWSGNEIESLKQAVSLKKWATWMEEIRLDTVFALGVMKKNKAELVTIWSKESAEGEVQKLADRLRESLQWMEGVHQLLEAAESRLLVAAAALISAREQREKVDHDTSSR